MKINPTTCLDFYKTDHALQYPKGTEVVYSNFTARSATHAAMSDKWDGKIVFFGLQGFIQWFLIDLWNTEFFSKPKDQVVAKYKRRMDAALGQDAVNVERIAALHDLGFLPLQIKALPEGSRVNLRVPLFTVVNTIAEFFWLTNYIETAISDEIWKPITIATIAADFRKQLDGFVTLTGSSPEFADWQCHDFSMRGMSGLHDSSSANAGHLLSNFGTDTVLAIDYLENYYLADCAKELIGGSVPATEHSVMCMGGELGEYETIKRLITEIYPAGIVSIVSDTWDFWHVITVTARQLKDAILNRKVNGLGQAKVVFRPDSGDPADILCGTVYVPDLSSYVTLAEAAERRYREIMADVAEGLFNDESEPESGYFFMWGDAYEVKVRVEWDANGHVVASHIESCNATTLTPAEKGAVECLWDTFGGTLTDKGFKTLHERVGLIYGDSITIERQRDILQRLMDKGFSAGNVVFGIGSYTYQMVTRDTFGMAMKATYGVVDGEARELFKDPITDIGGVKRSAKGLLRVEYEDGNFELYDQQTEAQERQGELQPVFFNGVAQNVQSLNDIRARLKSPENKSQVMQES